MDFTVPAGGSSGKALHFTASGDINDLSAYGCLLYTSDAADE